MRVMNFNAGPAVLPLSALERAKEELLDFAGSGMSVMEHSHRGKEYEAVHAEATSLLRELLVLPDTHAILFLQGGASMQFAMLPLNFLGAGKTAKHVVMGTWGEKALSEGAKVSSLCGGKAELLCSTGEGAGKEKVYARAPTYKEMGGAAGATYVHTTSNETIHGIQFHTLPTFDSVAHVCDMSSDFLYRPTSLSGIDLAYAGAQKNLGPSGVTVVLAKKTFLETARNDLPVYFDYRTHEKNGSLYNTPPTFGVYLIRNVLLWLKEEGGLLAAEARNRKKASSVYDAIDASGEFYRCPVERGSRSLMNVVFRLPTEELETAFVAAAKKEGMVGLRGHRVVGGIRASLYNAVSVEWAEALAAFIRDFAKRNG